MSIYEKQRMEIKQTILDTSIDLFIAKGYEETSITKITAEVGIAKGTFYNYFDSKKDILFVWAENTVKNLDISKALNPSSTIKENLYIFIEIITKAIVENERLYLTFLKEVQTMDFNTENEESFDFKSLYSNIFNISKDFNLIENKNLDTKIKVLDNCLFRGIIDYFNNHIDNKSLSTYLKEIVDICLYGIYSR